MRKRIMAMAGAILVSAALFPASASADEPRRADVALVAQPSAVEFVATRGAGTVRADYYNPGNVTKTGATITAEIPDGITVEVRPAPGWACHIDDWPALVCETDTALKPGDTVSPFEAVLTADAPVDTEIEFGTLGFYRDPTENPADNYSTVAITATAP